ncbi:MAG: Co2+/Mg2+ efflux protein ApaG [Gammaproteobacteria bacterium]
MDGEAIQVDVETQFLPDQSDVEEGRYVFAYTITIHNHGPLPVRLLTRRWLITDARGRTQEVAGDGVVGEQPTIRPNRYHRYSSFSVIETPVGTMEGHYGMIDGEGAAFDAPIPAFRLAVPGIVN